jgi:hypothetical protein
MASARRPQHRRAPPERANVAFVSPSVLPCALSKHCNLARRLQPCWELPSDAPHPRRGCAASVLPSAAAGGDATASRGPADAPRRCRPRGRHG